MLKDKSIQEKLMLLESQLADILPERQSLTREYEEDVANTVSQIRTKVNQRFLKTIKIAPKVSERDIHRALNPSQEQKRFNDDIQKREIEFMIGTIKELQFQLAQEKETVERISKQQQKMKLNLEVGYQNKVQNLTNKYENQIKKLITENFGMQEKFEIVEVHMQVLQQENKNLMEKGDVQKEMKQKFQKFYELIEQYKLSIDELMQKVKQEGNKNKIANTIISQLEEKVKLYDQMLENQNSKDEEMQNELLMALKNSQEQKADLQLKFDNQIQDSQELKEKLLHLCQQLQVRKNQQSEQEKQMQIKIDQCQEQYKDLIETLKNQTDEHSNLQQEYQQVLRRQQDIIDIQQEKLDQFVQNKTELFSNPEEQQQQNEDISLEKNEIPTTVQKPKVNF